MQNRVLISVALFPAFRSNRRKLLEDVAYRCILQSFRRENGSKEDAGTIANVVQDSLLRFQLPLRNCQGQCYDGANVVAGSINGVSALTLAAEPRAVFIHCFAHSLNKELQESSRSLPLYRDMIDYVKDIINLIRASPNRTRVLTVNRMKRKKRVVL